MSIYFLTNLIISVTVFVTFVSVPAVLYVNYLCNLVGLASQVPVHIKIIVFKALVVFQIERQEKMFFFSSIKRIGDRK